MKITRKDVDYVATLARLELSEEESERMVQQLDAILSYVAKLNELDTRKVKPMAQVLGESRPEVTLRADGVAPGLAHEEALAAAPDADTTFVRVPKVIER